MRDAFWHSQTSGRVQVVQALKLCCESCVAGDFAAAAAVLEAADLRLERRGELSSVFDSLGGQYRLPRYVYSTPSNVITDAEATALAAAKRRPHMGPPVPIGGVTIRISPSATNSEQDVKLPSLTSATTVRELRAALHELLQAGGHDQAAGPGVKRPNTWKGKGLPPVRQRVIFQGRELADECHMQEAGLTGASVLQIFVRPE